MDRYIIRETRLNSNFPQGNQTIAFSTNATNSNNIMPQENIYYGETYDVNQFAKTSHVPSTSFGNFVHMNAPMFGPNIHKTQGTLITGLDPRCLSNYTDNSPQLIAPGQIVQNNVGSVSSNRNFGFSNDSNYQNHNFVETEYNKPRTFTPQLISNETTRSIVGLDSRMNTPFQYQPNSGIDKQQGQYQNSPMKGQMRKTDIGHVSGDPDVGLSKDSMFGANYQNRNFMGAEKNKPKTFIPHTTTNVTSKVSSNVAPKKESHNQIVSRAQRLQALHKSGPRAFSGPVEKVLKWHKALQDIGTFIFYEIVAKCVSIRAGESCSKNLVIRDENGPAIQVVYYEIDFLLPEIKVPSTVRVIGRILPGTCRLHAFSVRPATGDDVAMLSRRAAVAAHHIAKLCKEYGVTI